MTLRRIGFIGLGAMGLPMAKNLLKNNFELHVAAHRNRNSIETLKTMGAIEEPTLVDLVAKCDCIITILPADREMEHVLLNPDIMEAINPNTVIIEMTSGSPEMMKKVHAAYSEKGVKVLDGPVSGGTIGAENGTLTIMAGGDADLLATVRNVLDAMAQNIYLVGPVGSGKAIKAINQMLAGIHMTAVAEAVSLAETLDIDLDKLKEVIGKSSGSSWMLENKAEGLVRRDFTPGFKLNLMKKDIEIAVNEARSSRLPLANFVLDLFKQAEKDHGNEDFSAIGKSVILSSQQTR